MKILQLKCAKVIRDPSKGYVKHVPYNYKEDKCVIVQEDSKTKITKSEPYVLKSERKKLEAKKNSEDFNKFIDSLFNS